MERLECARKCSVFGGSVLRIHLNRGYSERIVMPDLKKVQEFAKKVTQAATKAKAQAAKAKTVDAEAAKLLAEVKDLDNTVGE